MKNRRSIKRIVNQLLFATNDSHICKTTYIEPIMGTLKYKDYSGTVEYSEVDNFLFGKVIGMNKNIISYEGKTVEELKTDLNA